MAGRHIVDRVDVSLRALRQFVAVAEESHITRAAQRLHVAQPALSKTIARLERELDVDLFVRTAAGVEPTEAGRSLLPAARAALAAVDDWLPGARAAQQARRRTLHIGYHSSIPSDLIGPIVERFRQHRPDWGIEWRLGDWTDPAGPVRSGRVAAALLHLPVAGADELNVRVLRRDRRVVALPTGHRLAHHASLTLADLEDEPCVALPAAAGPLRDSWLATEQRQRPATIAREVENAEDWFQAVLSGQGVAMLTETSSHSYRRPGIAYRPVTDVPTSDLVVLWPRPVARDPALEDFLRACPGGPGLSEVFEPDRSVTG